MKLTPGKLAGMKAVSNSRGVIAAAAMDQRGSLSKALGANACDAQLEEFKIYVTEVLTQHASAILLDPEWGLPAARRRTRGSGLLLAYEKTGYDKALHGRRPDLLDLWSVKRLKAVGADCIKILLYYAPFDDQKVNNQKKAWVEHIGDECKAHDIPLFLELVGYEEGLDAKGVHFAKLKPGIVARSMEEFSDDRYGVDVLTVEIPVNLQFVQGAKSFKGTKVYTRKAALGHYRAAAEATNTPFIYSSAGVSNPEFIEDLGFAAEAGVKFNGVLCRRATWSDGIRIFSEKGAAAFRTWLEDEGVKNIKKVNNALKAATPWCSMYGLQESVGPCENIGDRSQVVPMEDFDVLLAHNSADKDVVEAIGKRLLRHGVRPWLDTWHLPPGKMFQDEIERVLPTIGCVAVFLGPSGTGRWQDIEMRSAISQFVRRRASVIPVLLPGARKIPELLGEFAYVQFQKQVDSEAVKSLIWGITGRKP